MVRSSHRPCRIFSVRSELGLSYDAFENLIEPNFKQRLDLGGPGVRDSRGLKVMHGIRLSVGTPPGSCPRRRIDQRPRSEGDCSNLARSCTSSREAEIEPTLSGTRPTCRLRGRHRATATSPPRERDVNKPVRRNVHHRCTTTHPGYAKTPDFSGVSMAVTVGFEPTEHPQGLRTFLLETLEVSHFSRPVLR